MKGGRYSILREQSTFAVRRNSNVIQGLIEVVPVSKKRSFLICSHEAGTKVGIVRKNYSVKVFERCVLIAGLCKIHRRHIIFHSHVRVREALISVDRVKSIEIYWMPIFCR